MSTRPARAVAYLALAAAPALSQDGAPADLREALSGGRPWLSFRYRFENVDQDGFAEEARASTLRTVLGYETLPFHDLRGLLELEDVRAVGNDAYDSTTNGNTSRPVVLDPESTEVNRAWVSYAPEGGPEVRLGRQRIQLDDDRFVGNVGWRQNEQTYDAVSLRQPLGEGAELFAAFVENVNTVLGDDSPAGDAPMESGLLHAAAEVGELGRLAAYWYHLDYDRAPGLSTSTLGARFDGAVPVGEVAEASFLVEYARQTDAGSNPASLDEGYYHLSLGGAVAPVEVAVGLEVLEGSGQPGEVFTTPLATLHAFNGWADKFVTNALPATGLEDAYVSVSGSLRDAKWKAVWHDFSAQDTSADYGRELDLMVTVPLAPGVVAGAKYANYMEDGFATDTEKLWAWLSFTP